MPQKAISERCFLTRAARRPRRCLARLGVMLALAWVPPAPWIRLRGSAEARRGHREPPEFFICFPLFIMRIGGAGGVAGWGSTAETLHGFLKLPVFFFFPLQV